MITKSFGSGTIKDRMKFLNLLERLQEYCDLINFEDAVNLILKRETVTRPKIAFSFDDGFEDCYTHIAPALEKYGINAIFFINPNFANAADNNDKEYIRSFTQISTKSPGKRPLSWKQIKELSDRGFLIGAHTLDHCNIASLSIEEKRKQITECKRIIEQRINMPCEYFAWPYGKLSNADEVAIDIACSTYKYVFSQCDYKHYFSFSGKVINRRHFEVWWPYTRVIYFLSFMKNLYKQN